MVVVVGVVVTAVGVSVVVGGWMSRTPVGEVVRVGEVAVVCKAIVLVMVGVLGVAKIMTMIMTMIMMIGGRGGHGSRRSRVGRSGRRTQPHTHTHVVVDRLVVELTW